WTDLPIGNDGMRGPWRAMPGLPDYWPVNEAADEDHPFKLATSPARNFINPSDAARLGLGQGDVVQLGNRRGRTRLHARLFEGVKPGVLVSEGVWPPSAFLDGWGINVLVGDDSVA